MKFLCIHGVGHQELSTDWQGLWSETIAKSLNRWSADIKPEFEFLPYDDLFEAAEFNAEEVGKALLKLATSEIFHGIGDWWDGRTRDMVARSQITEVIRWTGGMVAQWAADDALRADCSQRIAQYIKNFRPDVIVAHSLGTLITYDAFSQDKKLSQKRTLVTLGSQIGNPAVRSTFGGRLSVPDGLDNWYHLYNPHDQVFTARLPLRASKLVEIDAPFSDAPPLNHDALKYLGHSMASENVWRNIASAPIDKSLEQKLVRAFASAKRTPTRRALLVGINDYPDPANRLAGCVNDVFEVSATLQELGFDAPNIRVVLNERATANNIKDRLHWLLDDAEKEDIRFFFYSGHGAQMPGYSGSGEVDSIDECLVPYDFTWTPETAIIDDWFNELYSQLPYDMLFYVALDCCHAGGLTRAGARKAKGLEPPDDIRHRQLRWDKDAQMWVPRELPQSVKDLTKSASDRRDYTGESGALKRLGSAVSLWSDQKAFEQRKKRYNNLGPYTPLLMYACLENELSYEYRHGVQSYGAFTYCLTQLLKEQGQKKKDVTFEDAIKMVGAKLKGLGYGQTPNIVGPAIRRSESIFSLVRRQPPPARSEK
jgi:hypothetical protein